MDKIKNRIQETKEEMSKSASKSPDEPLENKKPNKDALTHKKAAKEATQKDVDAGESPA